MDFDAAVMAAYDTAARLQLRQLAEKYLESIYSSPEGLQICFEKLLLAPTSPAVNSLVRFACLKGVETIVLHRYAALTEDQRMYIRTNMFQFAQYILRHNEDHGNKEKYCRIITGLITHEYLDTWQTLFTNFRQVIRAPEIERGSDIDQRALDIYQRLLACITDYIVDPEAHHSAPENAHASAIKDRMRMDCIPTIALDWIEILECYHEINPPLVVRTLANIEKYIDWIDIGLIANPRALQAIFHCLSVQPLQSASCKCIREIVGKGMEPLPKLQLLLSFGLMGIPHLQPTDESFTMGLASLVDVIGQQLLPCIPYAQEDAALHAQACELLQGVFGQMFRFLAHESLEVSSKVIPLASAYLQRLKPRSAPITENEISELGALMQVITARMRYTAAYDFDDIDDYEQSFQEYRSSLEKLFNAIARLVPEHVCGYIEQLLRNTLASAPIRTIPMADVEVVLHMISKLNLEATHRDRLAAFFPVCIEIMIAGDIMAHGHPSVTLQFFELINRYTKYIPENPLYLSKILATFLDERALRNPAPRVRSRAAFLFLRTVKGLLPHLGPFVQPITQGLQPLLVVPALTENQQLPIEDQCHLFEVQGSLLGYYPDSHASLLEFTLAPIFESAQTVSASLGAQSDEKLGDYLARLIAAVASFLKGFEKRSMTDIANRCIEAVIQLCGKSLELQLGNQAIQCKVVFCLHRVIECLPQQSIATIIAPFLPLLVRGTPPGNVPAMIELLQLLTQLGNRCKAEFVPALRPIFAPLLHMVVDHTTKTMSARSDEEREADFLRRQYFALLLNLYENSGQAIFDLERAQRPVILNLLLGACHGMPAVSVSTIKPCIKILRRMVLEWRAEPEFQQFAIEHVIPLFFAIPFNTHFRQTDAESLQLLVEICALQQAVVSTSEAAQGQLASYLQTRQVDQATIAEYMNTLLTSKDPKALAVYFNSFVAKFRNARR